MGLQERLVVGGMERQPKRATCLSCDLVFGKSPGSLGTREGRKEVAALELRCAGGGNGKINSHSTTNPLVTGKGRRQTGLRSWES